MSQAKQELLQVIDDLLDTGATSREIFAAVVQSDWLDERDETKYDDGYDEGYRSGRDDERRGE